MYVHALDTSWWNHGFWSRRFLVRDQSELDRLIEAGVSELTIDTDKGLAPVVPATDESPETPEPVKLSPAAADRAEAQAVIDRSKTVVRDVFNGARLGETVCSSAVIGVVEDISGSVARNAHALTGLLRLKSKDEYTYLHSVAVCALMVNLARHLKLDEAEVKLLGLAGLLHDVGKMSVPTTILNKPDRLSDSEFAQVRGHAAQGAEMLRQGEDVPEIAIDVALHHHEKIDGTGYPHGLKGDEISLAARMGAICDVYDALTSERIYKGAWSPSEAVTAMRGWEGQFDRRLLFSFFQSLGVFPVGMLVRTRSDLLAIVLPNGRRASRPRIRTFFSINDARLFEPRDVILSDGHGDAIVGEEDPDDWQVLDWPGACAHLLLELDQVEMTRLRRLWQGEPKGIETTRASTPSVRSWQPLAGD